MKRFSRKDAINGIKTNGYVLRYNFWFTLHAGWKVENAEREILGYLTDIDAFYVRKAFNANELKEHKGFNNDWYTYNK